MHTHINVEENYYYNFITIFNIENSYFIRKLRVCDI